MLYLLGLFMHPFGTCYAAAFSHLSAQYFQLIVRWSIPVSILLHDFNLRFRRLRTSPLSAVLNESALVAHLARILTVSATEVANIFNSHRASRLSALESTPAKLRNLGPSGSSEAGHNAKASSGGTVYPGPDKDGMAGKWNESAKSEHKRLGHPPIPRLKPQPFPSGLNLQPSSVVCFRWISEGCKGTCCSVSTCFRAHRFHRDQPAADIQAYKDWVLAYIQF